MADLRKGTAAIYKREVTDSGAAANMVRLVKTYGVLMTPQRTAVLNLACAGTVWFRRSLTLNSKSERPQRVPIRTETYTFLVRDEFNKPLLAALVSVTSLD